MKKLLSILAALAVLTTAGCGSSKDTDGATDVFAGNGATAQPTDQEKYVTISLAGNVSLSSENSDFSDKYESKGSGYFFKNVKSFFEDDDLTIVNLDCIFSDDNEDGYKGVVDTKYTDILNDGSIDVVSTANEYADTLGSKGISESEKALDDANIKHVATGEADSLEINGVKVGLIGIYVEDDDYDTAEKDLTDAFDSFEAKPDVTIVSIHWGEAEQYEPTSDMKSLAHKAVDLGATLVAGTHPYPIAGIEKYNKSIICYSLGNLCYGFGECQDDYKDSFIYRQTFTIGNDGKVKDDDAYEIIPINVSSSEDENTFQPTPAATKLRLTRIEKTLEADCEKLDSGFIPWFNEDLCKGASNSSDTGDVEAVETDDDSSKKSKTSKTVTSDDGEKATVKVEE